MHKLVPALASVGLGHFTAVHSHVHEPLSSPKPKANPKALLRHWIKHRGHQKQPWSLLSISHAPSRMVAPQPLPQLWRCSLRCTGVQSHVKSFLEASRTCSWSRTRICCTRSTTAPHLLWTPEVAWAAGRNRWGRGELPPTYSVPKPRRAVSRQ